jgi:hypothetical protein
MERETCGTCGLFYEAVSISDCTASNVNNDKRKGAPIAQSV